MSQTSAVFTRHEFTCDHCATTHTTDLIEGFSDSPALPPGWLRFDNPFATDYRAYYHACSSACTINKFVEFMHLRYPAPNAAPAAPRSAIAALLS